MGSQFRWLRGFYTHRFWGRTKDSLLFDSDNFELSQQSVDRIQPVFKVLTDLPHIYKFAIEGHTDDVPIQTEFVHSNWELSSLRAIAVLNRLVDVGIEASRLSIRAFADQKPLVPNKNESGVPIEENRAKNRRVVVRIK